MMLEIEFGSRSRGDYDELSDRDLLLIGDDWQEIRSRRVAREEEHYSARAYTSATVDYLLDHGSLFLKHIIDEGTLVSGSEEKYQSLVKRWVPKSNYAHEIEENLDLLQVLAYVPCTQKGVAAALDILVCSVRNILIRRLAALGIYAFSWGEVTDEATKVGQLRNGDKQVVLAARDMKNLYRSGQAVRPSLELLGRMEEASCRAFGLPKLLSHSSRREIRGLPERFCDGSYKQLRAVELLCAEYGAKHVPGEFLAWVGEPHYFGVCGSGMGRGLIN